MRTHGFRADTAFDGERAIPGGALVLVADGLILGVEPGPAVAPDGVEMTFLPGTTLLPGLIDTHTHLCGDSTMAALLLVAGDPTTDITGIRDVALVVARGQLVGDPAGR